MRELSAEKPMTRNHLVRLVPAGALLMLFLGLPGRATAQVAPRTVADAPSRNPETLVQHDSLAVHFLRSPKVKPAARPVASVASPSSAKFRGRREPLDLPAPTATPLPTKKAAAKR